MTKLEKLIMSEDAQYIMEEVRNILVNIEAKGFTKEEEKFYIQRKNEYLKRLKEIMK